MILFGRSAQLRRSYLALTNEVITSLDRQIAAAILRAEPPSVLSTLVSGNYPKIEYKLLSHDTTLTYRCDSHQQSLKLAREGVLVEYDVQLQYLDIVVAGHRERSEFYDSHEILIWGRRLSDKETIYVFDLIGLERFLTMAKE